MRFMTWVLVLATWLFASTFFLPQTAASAVPTAFVAVAVMALALAAPGRPGLRFGITILALAMPFGALLLPDLAPVTRLNLLVVAPVLFALSLVAPVHRMPLGLDDRPLRPPPGPRTLDDEVLARPT